MLGDHPRPLPHSPPRLEDDLLTVVGRQRGGGCWILVGLAAVSASLTPETAMAETRAHQRYDNPPLPQTMPRTFVAIDGQLRLVCDLGDGRVRQLPRWSLRRLLEMVPIVMRRQFRTRSPPPVLDLGESMPRSDEA